MQGKANFRGHPIHLMLISFPVAFWSGALMTDTIGAATHDTFWFHMSVILLAMGTSGAVAAAIFGYIDYRSIRMSRKARNIATGHLWWSLATIGIFTAAYVARATLWSAPLGIGVTIVGSLSLLVSGFLGSELSNRYGIGTVDPKR